MHAIKQYIWHWLTALNEHSLQAPFIYNLYLNTLKHDFVHEDYNAIEQLRTKLIESKQEINVLNLGAKSKVNSADSRPVSDIAKKGITTARKSRLLARLISAFNCKNIIELGTSFGVNTLYLASKPETAVTSFEGCPETAKIAAKNFDELEYQNIDIVEGDINLTLSTYLNSNSPLVDFVFFDANHQLEPTLNYFNMLFEKAHSETVFVFDDIHWSTEMSKAWSHIAADSRVSMSIDLFDVGIIFFKNDFQKSHFRLRW